MEKSSVYKRCKDKEEDLLANYFPNYLHDAAIKRPEKLEPEYNDELPHKIEAEFGEWLAVLWKELNPQSEKTYEEIMNQHLSMAMTDAEYNVPLSEAKIAAEKITLWEQLIKTNHEDVTYYKGLLLEYTQKLLDTMIIDFTEDLQL